jgi:hypothetical protein
MLSMSTAATVKLHRTLYTQDAITEAAATFADFASFKVHGDGDYYVVDVTDITRDVEGDVVAEFCNFALANTASHSKASSSPTE